MWQPGIPDEDLMMYLRASRSMAAYAGMTVNAKDGEYDVNDGTVIAARDETTINAMNNLSKNKMVVAKSLEELLKSGGMPLPISQKWPDEEVKLFVKGLRTFGKNFFKIRTEFLRNKDTNDLVEFYYLWKKTPEGLANRQQRSMRGKKPAVPPTSIKNIQAPGAATAATTAAAQGGVAGAKLYNPASGRDSPTTNKSDVNVESDDDDSGHKENNNNASNNATNTNSQKPAPPPIHMSSSEDEKTVNFKKYAWMLDVKPEKRIQRRKKPQFGRRNRLETDSGELDEKRSKIEVESDSDEEMEGIDFKRKSNKRRRIAREKRRSERRTQNGSTQNGSESDDETEDGSEDSTEVVDKRVKRVAVSGSGDSSEDSTESDGSGGDLKESGVTESASDEELNIDLKKDEYKDEDDEKEENNKMEIKNDFETEDSVENIKKEANTDRPVQPSVPQLKSSSATSVTENAGPPANPTFQITTEPTKIDDSTDIHAEIPQINVQTNPPATMSSAAKQLDGLPALQTTNPLDPVQIKQEAQPAAQAPPLGGAETPLPPTPTGTSVSMEFPTKIEPDVEIKEEETVKAPPPQPPQPLQVPRNSGRPTWKLPGKPEPTNQMWAQTIEQDIESGPDSFATPQPYVWKEDQAKACKVLVQKPNVSNTKKQMMNDFYLMWDRGNVTCSRTDIVFEPREGSSFYHKRKRKLQERLAKEEQAKLEKGGGEGQIPGQISGQFPGQIPGQISGHIPGQIQGQISAQNPSQILGQIPGQVQAQIHGQTPGQISGQLPGQLPGQLTGQSLGNQSASQNQQGQIPGQQIQNQQPQGQQTLPGLQPSLQPGQQPVQIGLNQQNINQIQSSLANQLQCVQKLWFDYLS